MNLTFRHSGLQFFFITLTLEGRPPMLSRLIEGEARPVLLPAGEVVQAYLRAFHAVYPAVTISDRVIMPDHVHFLMIVRYDQAPGFNPLWASFALMKAIEAAEAQRNGGDAPAPPEAAAHFAEILTHERATAARIERFMHKGPPAPKPSRGWGLCGHNPRLRRGCGGRSPPSVRRSASTAAPTSSSPSTRASSRPFGATSSSTRRVPSGNTTILIAFCASPISATRFSTPRTSGRRWVISPCSARPFSYTPA